jgi:hypothetical protein
MPKRFILLAVTFLLSNARANAGTEQLSLSSTVQYSRVIQGAVEPVNAYVYNEAPAGSDTGNYRVTADYAAAGASLYTNVGYNYVGSVAADGGVGYASMTFPINTTTFTPGMAAVKVTCTDKDTGSSVTQGGQFMVLAHANPALVINGQIVYLTSQNVVKFTNNSFAESTPSGTEAAGSFNPQMLGDPPGEPTAELDLDSITTSGSPYITTNLQPFTDLPSDDDPAEAKPFEIDIAVPTLGDYATTFTLHYSDEDDLPGAAAPGSEELSFNVEANVSSSTIDWTITTVPEPASGVLTGMGVLCLLFMSKKLSSGYRLSQSAG